MARWAANYLAASILPAPERCLLLTRLLCLKWYCAVLALWAGSCINAVFWVERHVCVSMWFPLSSVLPCNAVPHIPPPWASLVKWLVCEFLPVATTGAMTVRSVLLHCLALDSMPLQCHFVVNPWKGSPQHWELIQGTGYTRLSESVGSCLYLCPSLTLQNISSLGVNSLFTAQPPSCSNFLPWRLITTWKQIIFGLVTSFSNSLLLSSGFISH